MHDEKIRYQWPIAEFNTTNRSLEKDAMNAPRICKLCNGVTKRLDFSIFQVPKAEQRPLRTCQLRNVNVNDDLSNEPNFGRIHLDGLCL